MPNPKLKEGLSAPALSLPNADGKTIKLSDFKGKKNVILYFYPKDDTPGCTKEACSFSTAKAEFERFDAVILGVSKDGKESHEKFMKKHNLTVELLTDEGNKIAEKYGIYREKTSYGKTALGIVRSTFLIDKEGKIARIWDGVKVDGHDEKVLAALKEIN